MTNGNDKSDKMLRVSNIKLVIEDVPVHEKRSKTGAVRVARASDLFVQDVERLAGLLAMKPGLQRFLVEANEIRDRDEEITTANGTAYALNKRFHGGRLPLFARGLSNSTIVEITRTAEFEDRKYKGKYSRATLGISRDMMAWLKSVGYKDGEFGEVEK